MYIIPRLLLLSLGFPLLFFDCRHFLEFQFFFSVCYLQRDSYEQQFRGFRIRYFFEKSREAIYIYTDTVYIEHLYNYRKISTMFESNFGILLVWPPRAHTISGLYDQSYQGCYRLFFTWETSCVRFKSLLRLIPVSMWDLSGWTVSYQKYPRPKQIKSSWNHIWGPHNTTDKFTINPW